MKISVLNDSAGHTCSSLSLIFIVSGTQDLNDHRVQSEGAVEGKSHEQMRGRPSLALRELACDWGCGPPPARPAPKEQARPVGTGEH